jgi:hypothetical protein
VCAGPGVTEPERSSAAETAVPRPRRVSGVRATPGGAVLVVGLADGWAVFPDDRARFRRAQIACAVGALVAFGIEYLLQRTHTPGPAEGIVALVGIGLFVVVFSLGDAADWGAARARRRRRAQSTVRAGGRDAVGQAVRRRGRARTVAEMNVLLSSLGRTDPVYSLDRVRRGEVRRRWWQTTVHLHLTGDHQLVYRVVGLRAPVKLAAIFATVERP